MKAKSKTTKAGGDYFKSEKIDFIPSGSILLDCVLGGGYALGRVVNVVGDRSVGKTLLAIEAAANFAREYPKGLIWYREAEAAFDLSYAELVGLPAKRVDFGPDGLDTMWDTIDAVSVDFEECIKEAQERGVPGLYIIDSLDALSSVADMNRKAAEPGYKLEKVKLIGEMFQRNVRGQRAANVCQLIISQVRDNIGVTYGKKYKRSGGRSLDFYASQTIYLSHRQQLARNVGALKLATGILINARTDKNKIGRPFRNVDIPILFEYGLDDLGACIRWLKEANQLSALSLTEKTVQPFVAEMAKIDQATYNKRMDDVRAGVEGAWRDIEKQVTPMRRKYA